MSINGFKKETIKELQSYVYRLIDPRNGNTFYVGKGKGNRVFHHANGELLKKEYLESQDDVTEKIKTIKEIKKANLDVIYVIHRWGLDNKTAFEVESALMDAYPGLSNIQGGHNSDHGVCSAEEIDNRFSLPIFEEPDDFKYLIIKVKEQTVDDLEEEYGSEARYNATRSAWKRKKESVEGYPYVLSVTNGVVEEVYAVEEWIDSIAEGRIEFIGKIADTSVRNKFINKRIPKRFTKKGLASPVLCSDSIK